MVLKSAEQHISVSVFCFKTEGPVNIRILWSPNGGDGGDGDEDYIYLFVFLVTRQLNDQLQSQHQHAWNGTSNEIKIRKKVQNKP